jgi:translation initiation factor 2 beta subunit (eIF-2beta)/eIF-5
MSDAVINKICKECGKPADHSTVYLENGRYKLVCLICGFTSPIYDKDGKEIDRVTLIKYQQDEA